MPHGGRDGPQGGHEGYGMKVLDRGVAAQALALKSRLAPLRKKSALSVSALSPVVNFRFLHAHVLTCATWAQAWRWEDNGSRGQQCRIGLLLETPAHANRGCFRAVHSLWDNLEKGGEFEKLFCEPVQSQACQQRYVGVGFGCPAVGVRVPSDECAVASRRNVPFGEQGGDVGGDDPQSFLQSG